MSQIAKHLENPSSSETLRFNPKTGTLEVVPKGGTTQRTHYSSGADQTVALDMNKPGSGGFFSLVRHGCSYIDSGNMAELEEQQQL